jgi:hypothetical protein
MWKGAVSNTPKRLSAFECPRVGWSEFSFPHPKVRACLAGLFPAWASAPPEENKTFCRKKHFSVKT